MTPILRFAPTTNWRIGFIPCYCRCGASEELARLLTSFETVLPLREPSHLSAAPLYELILRRSEGTIGEIATLLARVTAPALLNGDECIDCAIIERADYHPSSVRRRMVERELH